MSTSGGQPGNQNAKKAKRWIEAINKALARFETDSIKAGQALDKIAEKVVTQAIEGDKDSWQEIANRLDGKVPQAIVGDDDSPPLRFEKVERVIVRPNAPDTDG